MSFGCWDSPWDQSLRLLGAEQEITAFCRKLKGAKVAGSQSLLHIRQFLSHDLWGPRQRPPWLWTILSSWPIALLKPTTSLWRKKKGDMGSEERVLHKRQRVGGDGAVVSSHRSTVGLIATHLLCTLWPFLMNKMFLPHAKRLKNQKKRSLEIFILLLHKLLVWTPSVKLIKSLLLCIHGPSAFVKQ